MRALDPRLLRRTRSARSLLATDTVLGICAGIAVLVQAGLLARIVARAFDGAPLRSLRLEFGALVAAFVLRGACAWAMEVTGRRAAQNVMSELRLALVEKRLRDDPLGVDGVDGAEIVAVTVQGVDALEGYFARYLPLVVLASVLPLLVIAWVAVLDLESALIMALTLPLVPVFMWLIGRYTEQRTRARWEALRMLSIHFLDVVRGLADAQGVRPCRGARSRRGRSGRALPRDDDGDAAGELPLGLRARARCNARRRARCGHRGSAPRRRQPRRSGRAHGARPRARAVPPVPPPRRRVPCERGRARRGRADVRAARRPGDRGRLGRRASARAKPRHARDPDRERVVLLPVSLHGGCSTASTSSSSPERPSRWSAPAAPARAPSPLCCSVSFSPGGGRISVGGVDLADLRPRAVASARRLGATTSELFRGTVAENIRLGNPDASDPRWWRPRSRRAPTSSSRALPGRL